jgi:hypothetical protein
MLRMILTLVACGILTAVTFAEEKYVKLVHVASDKVLSVADSSEDAGAKAVVAKDDGSKSQQWKIEKDGEHYKIVNRKSGKVLDVEQESLEDGGAIIQWDDKAEGNDNQRWSWDGSGKERRLKSKSSNLVLDVAEDAGVIQKKADEKAKGQLWRVVEVKE